jgi:hypothetical protein
LKKNLDSVKRSDNCFGLRLKGVKTGKVLKRGKKDVRHTQQFHQPNQNG